MKLAHIAPTSLLGYLPPQQSAYFAISEMIDRDTKYADFYRDRAREGKLVIIDNPVHEDRPLDFGQFFRAVSYVRPTVAILPDVIDDPEKTVTNARGLIPELQDRCPGVVPMVVPHGITHEMFLDCASRLVSIRSVGFLGLTLERRLKDDPLAYRRRRWRLALLRKDERFRDVHIHYLGISERADEFTTDEHNQVYSADTAKFAVRALTKTAELPPGPLSTTYPGRQALGGSFGYLGHTPGELILDPQWLRTNFTDNLAAWSAAAEGTS